MQVQEPKITDKQRDILEFIWRRVRELGSPPTQREIAERFEISASTAREHLHALERRGWIKIDRGKSRGIKIVRRPREAN